MSALIEYLTEHAPALIVSFTGTLLALSAGTWIKAYMTASGKRIATKEDIDDVIKRVSRVTRTTSRIKSRVDGALWEDQNRWQNKRDFYVEAVVSVERTLSALRDLKRMLAEAREAPPAEQTQLEAPITEADQKTSGLFLDVHLIMKKGRLFISKSAVDAWDDMIGEWAKSAPEKPTISDLLKHFNDSPSDRLNRKMGEQVESTNKMIAAMQTLEDGLFKIARSDLRIGSRKRRKTGSSAIST
jgi:hypothetical protein